MMSSANPICLGGGHGVRSYLPEDLQRYSIDLDFYSSNPDIQNVLAQISKLAGFKQVGYGMESEGKYKRFDSLVPDNIKKCTVAITKEYKQSFKHGEVESKFYVTISNTLDLPKHELRKPKSYIGIEYVKEKIPVLPPAPIIASKVRIIPIRKVKDLYKDIFDVYALLKLGDCSVQKSDIVEILSKNQFKIKKFDLLEKLKAASGIDGAKNAIKLSSSAKDAYLSEWDSIHDYVKALTLEVLEKANMLE